MNRSPRSIRLKSRDTLSPAGDTEVSRLPQPEAITLAADPGFVLPDLPDTWRTQCIKNLRILQRCR